MKKGYIRYLEIWRKYWIEYASMVKCHNMIISTKTKMKKTRERPKCWNIVIYSRERKTRIPWEHKSQFILYRVIFGWVITIVISFTLCRIPCKCECTLLRERIFLSLKLRVLYLRRRLRRIPREVKLVVTWRGLYSCFLERVKLVVPRRGWYSC